MSYLDHIKQCNNFSAVGYLPFKVSNELIGWCKLNFVEKLKAFDNVFEISSKKIDFIPSINTPEKRTKAIALVVKTLYQQQVISSWVGETYAISNNFNDAPFFFMERAAVGYFGVRSYGVHVNGLVQKADGIYIWIARRTKDKPFWPGKLDQVVAGGQPANIGLLENVIKESAEEANIPESIAKQATLESEIHYLGKNSLKKSPEELVTSLLGTASDTLFNYDLWLPEGFIPENTDGEVDEFILMSLQEMAHLTDTTNEFKNNCNLVNIDLLIRRGVITELHPDFDEINKRLYVPARLS